MTTPVNLTTAQQNYIDSIQKNKSMKNTTDEDVFNLANGTAAAEGNEADYIQAEIDLRNNNSTIPGSDADDRDLFAFNAGSAAASQGWPPEDIANAKVVRLTIKDAHGNTKIVYALVCEGSPSKAIALDKNGKPLKDYALSVDDGAGSKDGNYVITVANGINNEKNCTVAVTNNKQQGNSHRIKDSWGYGERLLNDMLVEGLTQEQVNRIINNNPNIKSDGHNSVDVISIGTGNNAVNFATVKMTDGSNYLVDLTTGKIVGPDFDPAPNGAKGDLVTVLVTSGGTLLMIETATGKIIDPEDPSITTEVMAEVKKINKSFSTLKGDPIKLNSKDAAALAAAGFDPNSSPKPTKISKSGDQFEITYEDGSKLSGVKLSDIKDKGNLTCQYTDKDGVTYDVELEPTTSADNQFPGMSGMRIKTLSTKQGTSTITITPNYENNTTTVTDSADGGSTKIKEGIHTTLEAANNAEVVGISTGGAIKSLENGTVTKQDGSPIANTNGEDGLTGTGNIIQFEQTGKTSYVYNTGGDDSINQAYRIDNGNSREFVIPENEFGDPLQMPYSLVPMVNGEPAEITLTMNADETQVDSIKVGDKTYNLIEGSNPPKYAGEDGKIYDLEYDPNNLGSAPKLTTYPMPAFATANTLPNMKDISLGAAKAILTANGFVDPIKPEALGLSITGNATDGWVCNGVTYKDDGTSTIKSPSTDENPLSIDTGDGTVKIPPGDLNITNIQPDGTSGNFKGTIKIGTTEYSVTFDKNGKILQAGKADGELKDLATVTSTPELPEGGPEEGQVVTAAQLKALGLTDSQVNSVISILGLNATTTVTSIDFNDDDTGFSIAFSNGSFLTFDDSQEVGKKWKPYPPAAASL